MLRRREPALGWVSVKARRSHWLAILVAAVALAFAAPAGGATVIDTASATGSGDYWSDVAIHAQTGPDGRGLGGRITFNFGILHFSEPVRCLRVTGPDRGAGTASAPTTAILYAGPSRTAATDVAIELVDHGGGGVDEMNLEPVASIPPRCTVPASFLLTSMLTSGRAVVFDAP